MYIAILGRQPNIGAAELESLYGDISWFSDETVLVSGGPVDLIRLGGSQKIGRVVKRLNGDGWSAISDYILDTYTAKWKDRSGKITLGLSLYGFSLPPAIVQKTGLTLKSKLKKHGVSLRLVPNQELALSTATCHHNKLGLSDNKIELIIVRGRSGNVVIAESEGSQNITAYANRDQKRPKRDAFVGMLPPKLAQIMINLSSDQSTGLPSSQTILDPFCGTGVVLQEAAIMGYQTYGSDLAPKMIDYSRENLDWLAKDYYQITGPRLEVGDATKHRWQKPISKVVGEVYLGQPFSAPPSPAKLKEVTYTCNAITTSFLKNIGAQIEAGTRLCLAVPAWRRTDEVGGKRS